MKLFIFLVLTCFACQVKSLYVLEIMKMGELIGEGLWKTFAVLEGAEGPRFFANANERLLMDRIIEITKKLNAIDEKLNRDEATTFKQLENLDNKILYEMHLAELLQVLSKIELAYEPFQGFLNTGIEGINKTRTDEQYERHTLESFATHVVSLAPDSVYSSLKKLNSLINRSESEKLFKRKGFYEVIKQYFKNNKHLICEREQSVQQLLFNMYTVLQITQLKAYTMIEFSWMLLKLYNKGNFTVESEKLKHYYMEQMSLQAKAINWELKDTPNDIMRCDPLQHVKDETYTELTKFLQGYIVNEVDLNEDGTCWENCKFYTYTKQQGCFKEQFCSKQPTCEGNVVGCNYVDSDMWVCQAPAVSSRRYEWIEYENGRNLGHNTQTCTREITKVDSWWRWLFWHCSYCFCFCDDPKDPKSERFFNLRSVVSDTGNNKVMTGVRFVKSNKTIHLQIQEGKLVKDGQIDASTVTWHPIESYSVDDPSVTEGVDYHMLTWEHRAIDLDDLIAPEGHVLTGIRFRKIGSHLNLEIQIAEFDFNTGKLIEPQVKSMWISNDNTDGAYVKPRTRVSLQNPDVPTRFRNTPTHPDSKSGQFIEFTSSDLDLDAGQTAVPLIDTQLVASSPPVPLVGAGIYHKGKKNSGGFIAPKVFTYNYAPHILDVFPEAKKAEF